jgi:hypothetical protein
MAAVKARAPQDLEAPRAVTGRKRAIDIDAQRRSFAFGNCAIENPRVTKELVARVDKELRARPAK